MTDKKQKKNNTCNVQQPVQLGKGNHSAMPIEPPQKAKKTISQKIKIVCIAAAFVFLFYDLIEAFVEVFLPEGEVKISIAEQQYGESQGMAIYREGYPKEIFNLIRKAVKEKETAGEKTGWIFTQGVTGESWTSIICTTPGSEISMMVRKDPDYAFTVWDSAFEMTVESGPTETISNRQDGTLLQVHPFKESCSKRIIQIILRIIAFSVFCGILNIAIEGKRTVPVKKE